MRDLKNILLATTQITGLNWRVQNRTRIQGYNDLQIMQIESSDVKLM